MTLSPVETHSTLDCVAQEAFVGLFQGTRLYIEFVRHLHTCLGLDHLSVQLLDGQSERNLGLKNITNS